MMKNSRGRLPFIPLRGMTVFPNMITSFAIGREDSIHSLEYAMDRDETVVLVAQRDVRTDKPEIQDLYDVGTIARIKQVLNLPSNSTHIIVEGIKRFRLISLEEENNCRMAVGVEINAEDTSVNEGTEALMRIASEMFDEYIRLEAKPSGVDSVVNLLSAEQPGQLADVIASGLSMKYQQKQKILEMFKPVERLEYVLETLQRELQIMRIKKELEEKVKRKVSQTQKEYYLREQLKVIQEELGDKDGIQADIEKFTGKMKEKKMPKDVEEVLSREIDKLAKIQASSPEANVIRTYIECILNLPWTEKTRRSFDLKKAENILNQDHYGLEKVKERIVEYLAVRKNAPETNSTIICLVGPPGVGKTSVARSVARALGRVYVRMSLGGVKDEAEIRGHRRTYIGAMPGRIINAMKQAKVNNPLILLDEVDKLSQSYNGDPASALLEVLDGEQNFAFRDHYLEIPYDLSKVLFLCTANSLDGIPKPLQDRMEIITLSSYTEEEKFHIAKEHLYPKQLKKHGLTKTQLKITDEAFYTLINYYTKEAGVRQLERTVGEICRKTVKWILAGEKTKLLLDEKMVSEVLGNEKYHYDKIYDKAQVGIVRGLAWTQVGGDTLSIEVNTMKGSGKFELTGNMGDVMKESAKAAVSYIRANADGFQIDSNFYKECDIHIHIPEGAVPKDGPSAGITMATAMLSALTKTHVREDVAMTGEITIRGRVLPIGGLKEKVIAAKRAGIHKIIIPFENQADLGEIPKAVKEGIEFVAVREMGEVLQNALVEGEMIWK